MAGFAQDALQSFVETYHTSAQSDIDSIPQSRPQCCCGNNACSFLQHNQVALDDLERELQNSARLGQALLVRHETYMADAEKQRQDMSRQLDSLEHEKRDLQIQNTTLVQENRNLLDQLEALNNAVVESDAQIVNMQATLQSAQQECHKLSQLAARTEVLERELSIFEHEQATWQASLSAKEQSEKTAMRRWHDAERTLTRLTEQLERIERESSEEKQRHAEVVIRMERRHAVEKQLTGAADRLRSSTVAAHSGSGSNVVSHFVKDILQDNATLQMGIVELRDMLQSSNEEVEKLRNQLVLHQPNTNVEEERPSLLDRSVSLNDELSKSQAQELHVHHHYHAPSTQAPTRSNSLRRQKKKRYPATSNALLSLASSGRSTPRSSISLGHNPSSAATILQQTAVTVPSHLVLGNRWSSMSSSAATPSVYSTSVPASPVSTTYRTSSIFDRVFSDAGNESTSPPTSDGEAFASPYFPPVGGNKNTRLSSRRHSSGIGHTRGYGAASGKQSLDSILDTSIEDLPPLDTSTLDPEVIAEEHEGEWQEEEISPAANDNILAVTDDSAHDYSARPWHRPPLRRAASHESLLSISGMDIHTLKERPSQLLIPNAGLSSSAVVSDLQVLATRSSGGEAFQRSGKSILSGMAADRRKPQQPSVPAIVTTRPTLSKKPSGWLFGRWGASPTSEPTNNDTAPAPRPALASERCAPSIASSNSDRLASPVQKSAQIRSPGINQPGPVFGFLPETKIQHPPVMKSLDQDELANALGGSRG